MKVGDLVVYRYDGDIGIITHIDEWGHYSISFASGSQLPDAVDGEVISLEDYVDEKR